MKILHIVPSYIPAYRYGGPIHSVHGLCKGLVQRGHDVTVCTTNIDGPANLDIPIGERVDLDGVGVFYFQVQFPRRLVYSPQLANFLKRQIRHFDIVHIHSMYLYPTWAGASSALNAGIPYIIAPRGMMVKGLVRAKSWIPKTLWLQIYGKNIFRKAAGLHFTTSIEQIEFELFGYKIHGKKLIVPNGLDVPPIIDSDKAAKVLREFCIREPFVLSLGRINWEKGLERAIEAWSRVSKADLVIAGNDEEGLIPKLQKQVQKLGLAQRIKFIGPAYGDDKLVLFSKASCFILPSFSENFGNVVLEALAAETPVVVTPQVGLSKLIQKSGAGLVVNGTPVELAGAVNTLLKSSEDSNKMGKLGLQAVRNSYTWDTISSKMESEYRAVIERATEK